MKERLVPGLTFQVIDGHFLVIDFFPQLGYQLNTRWTAGIGGVYRTNTIKKQSEGKVKYDMAGLGMYTTFQVWKSFWLYAEADRNNVKLHIPSPAAGIPGTVTHQVEWELLLGIKKAHQFTPARKRPCPGTGKCTARKRNLSVFTAVSFSFWL